TTLRHGRAAGRTGRSRRPSRRARCSHHAGGAGSRGTEGRPAGRAGAPPGARPGHRSGHDAQGTRRARTAGCLETGRPQRAARRDGSRRGLHRGRPAGESAPSACSKDESSSKRDPARPGSQHRPDAVTHALQINEIEAARERLLEVRRQVSTVYIGDSSVVDTMLVALLARGHVLLEGVRGVAKTTLVNTFATTLASTIRRVQFTPDLLPADITGTYVLNPKEGTFSLQPGPIFSHVVLADEINRAPAKAQSALLEAMQERQVTSEGARFTLPDPFVVLATQNPVDLEGTYPLPEAQIDRFLVHVTVGYPGERAEIAMLRAHGVTAPEPRPVLNAQDVLQIQGIAARVHVEDDIHEYVRSEERRVGKEGSDRL